MKLDEKDKKILKELDINFRQPFSQIAKKVNLSKNAVINSRAPATKESFESPWAWINRVPWCLWAVGAEPAGTRLPRRLKAPDRKANRWRRFWSVTASRDCPVR